MRVQAQRRQRELAAEAAALRREAGEKEREIERLRALYGTS